MKRIAFGEEEERIQRNSSAKKHATLIRCAGSLRKSPKANDKNNVKGEGGLKGDDLK
jgi:hypothetical protein